MKAARGVQAGLARVGVVDLGGKEFAVVADLGCVLGEPPVLVAPLPVGQVLEREPLESVHDFTVGNVGKPLPDNIARVGRPIR